MENVLYVFLAFFLAGTFDFYFKEGAKNIVKLLSFRPNWYSNMPKIFNHPQWAIICTSIWVAILIYYGITIDNKIFLGATMFWMEDFVYYSWKFWIYNEPLPFNMPWLLPSFIVNKYNVNLTSSIFKSVLIIQIILFTISWNLI